ncbi:MAG: M36 family metallopeptidase [Armatimonadota bacterium]
MPRHPRLHRLAAPAALFSALLATGAGAASLPDFDIQSGSRGTTLPPPPGALSTSGKEVPAGTVIKLDALTGTASRVSHPRSTLTRPSSLPAEQVARGFLRSASGLFRLRESDLAAVTRVHQHSTEGPGVSHVTFGQQFQGIPVFKAEKLVHVDRRGRVLSASGALVPELRATISAVAPRLSAAEAVRRALHHASIPAAAPGRQVAGPIGKRRETRFVNDRLLTRPAEVELSYLPVAPGRTALAWDTTLWLKNSTAVYHVLVDATTGDLLFRKNYTQHAASGLIYDHEAPQDGAPYLGTTPPVLPRVTAPFNGSDHFQASDPHFDWWAGESQTSSLSNNVRAVEDRDNDGRLGGLFDVQQSNFAFELDLSKDPAQYLAASVTNLFYWNNYLHDVWYTFGFNEAARNFQHKNFGLGGIPSDSILAVAQLGADVSDPKFRNNASMSVPPDGQAGQMLMYVWDEAGSPLRDGSLSADIIAHEYFHGVSLRLVGNANGLNGFQGGAIGEGLSDFAALMVHARQIDDPLGTYPIGGYVLNDFRFGIRKEPYSVNPNVFTRTYRRIGDLRNGQLRVHDGGEILCNALWQTYARLYERLGFTQAKRRSMQLLIDALKLSPADPTFLDFRDALLLADQNRYGGDSRTEIWRAFASRGMGFSATTTGPDDTAPQEAFNTPDPIPGDTNGDGFVNVVDLQTLVNVVRGVTPKNVEIQDVNGDSDVTDADYDAFLELYLAMEDDFLFGGDAEILAKKKKKVPFFGFHPGKLQISALAFDLIPGKNDIVVELKLARNDLRLAAKTLGNRRGRVVLFSTTGQPIPKAAKLLLFKAKGLKSVIPLDPSTDNRGSEGASPAATLHEIPYVKGGKRGPGLG